MSLLRDKLFSSMVISHWIVDVLNGQRAVLLAFWSGPLGLTNTAIGIVSTIYVTLSAFSQPLFGWLSDKYGPKLISAGGVLWMGAWFAVAALFPGRAALVFLIIGSIGSGAFHPSGSVQAAHRGMAILDGRESTATSVFFLFGQAGGFFGPLMGGPLLDRFGIAGLFPLIFLTLPIGLFAWSQLAREPAYVHDPAGYGETSRMRLATGWGTLVALIIVAAFQNWAQQNMVTFVPKYMNDLGQRPSSYGLISSLFMGGYALGNFVGGNLADRLGKRPVIITTLLVSCIPMLLFALTGFGGWSYLLIPLSGIFLGAAFSVTVVFSQKVIPGGKALATGLVLGFMFSSGSIGTLASGAIADRWGFPPVFFLTALISLFSGLAGFFLNENSAIQRS